MLIEQDFAYSKLENQQWSFHFHQKNKLQRNRNALPIPALRGAYQLNNAACALAVVECLYTHLPIDIGSIKRGLLLVENAGRFQVLAGRPVRVLDVGHNPHAARALRQGLLALPFAEKRIAVFSMLADKDMDGVLDILKDQFDYWYIAPLHMPRGMNNNELQNKLAAHQIESVRSFASIEEAYQAALAIATENDRIIVFGSFHTVAEVMALMMDK